MYQHDFVDYSTRPKSATVRPRTVMEVRRELDRRHAQKAQQGAQEKKPSFQDLQAAFMTSEAQRAFRSFSEKEAADARGTFCDWHTAKASYQRNAELKEAHAAKTEQYEARAVQRSEARAARAAGNQGSRRPPKVPLRRDDDTASNSSTSTLRRPKSLAEILHGKKGSKKTGKDDDASSVATTASAWTASEVGSEASVDSARTDLSSFTAASARSSSGTMSSARSSASIRSASSAGSSSSRMLSTRSVTASMLEQMIPSEEIQDEYLMKTGAETAKNGQEVIVVSARPSDISAFSARSSASTARSGSSARSRSSERSGSSARSGSTTRSSSTQISACTIDSAQTDMSGSLVGSASSSSYDPAMHAGNPHGGHRKPNQVPSLTLRKPGSASAPTLPQPAEGPGVEWGGLIELKPGVEVVRGAPVNNYSRHFG